MFNDLPRGPEQSSMALVPDGSAPPESIPAVLGASLNQLVVEKLPSSEQFDLAVRDAKTGFTFFNIEGHQYEYDAKAQSLRVTGGRLLVSKQFSNALGRPSNADKRNDPFDCSAGIKDSNLSCAKAGTAFLRVGREPTSGNDGVTFPIQRAPPNAAILRA